MPRRSCDGAGFLAAFRAAVANLEANVDEVNALNVFPVPDGDTGTNMLATVRAALEEGDRAGPDADAAAVAHAVAFGALMGARGNSGVIASQILAGIADGLAGKRRFNGLDLAHALDTGTRKAYKAVAKPVEGTILTVIREASVAAVAAAERENELDAVLASTVEAAERAVAKTPSLLPILREAHVVDSGGQGLYRLFQGALEAARGGASAGVRTTRQPATTSTATDGGVSSGTDETAYGYETVYLLRSRRGHVLDVPAIQAHLESIGDSVLVAGDQHMAKVHVHNNRPDAVIAYGLGLGTLSRITVENLDGQARDVRESKAQAFIGVGSATPTLVGGAPAVLSGVGHEHALDDRIAAGVPVMRLPLGVIAVAPSEGLATLLTDVAAHVREYGVFRIVHGGQTANPSTGELLEAVEATPADELLLLPNNPNVVLAARQVASMTDRPVHVVPTRNCAEGVAALMELDPSASAAENADAMSKAGRALQTMQVTDAVRDATISGTKVRKGQAIVLDPDDGLLAVDNDPEKAVLAAFRRLAPGFGLVTIYYGEGATLDAAESLAGQIQAAAPGLEAVELAHGGQPHYRYLISAE
jgi:DAK2 domain fusion protein YloV